MKGNLRFRAGAWRLQVYAGKDPDTGLHRRVTATVREPDTRAGRKVAESELHRLILAVEGGKHDRRGDNPTVADLLARWMELRGTDFSPSTANAYRLIIPTSILPRVGTLKVRALHTYHLDKLYRDLERAGGRDGGPLAPATVRKVHTIMSGALKQAVRWGIIETSPALMAQPPKVPKPHVEAATEAEVLAILAAAAEHDVDYGVFVIVAAVTGARRSQVLGLHWDDLDLTAGTLTIQRAIVKGQGGLVEKGTKSGTVTKLPLEPAVLAILAGHRARHPGPGDGYVFSRPDGQPWHPDTTSDRWGELRHLSGIRPSVKLHGVRHYVVTALLAAGLDARTVADYVSHANPNMTLNVYAHALPAQTQVAAGVLTSALHLTPEPTKEIGS